MRFGNVARFALAGLRSILVLARRWPLWLALILASCASQGPATPRVAPTITAGSPAAIPSPSGAPSAGMVPTQSSVPALTVDHPTVTVTPATGLVDGQLVRISVVGFGVGGTVRLSECASAAAATDLGCGAQLAAQTLLATDDARAGSALFIVHAAASGRPLAEAPASPCGPSCVVVATLGDGYPFALAPMAFASTMPPACAPRAIVISLVDTAAYAGTVGGYLRFMNAGSAACRLTGWPTVHAVTPSGTAAAIRHATAVLHFPNIDAAPTVVLEPGEAAYAAVAASDLPPGSGAGTCPTYRTLRVGLPGEAPATSLSAWLPYAATYLPACWPIDVTMVVPAFALEP
jgi:prolyl-tRNA editing enzyme YbaK/EbsC (Cys-tRNA(Pro) deacylase)